MVGHMRSACCRLGWIALIATAACGGDLLGAPSDAGNDVPIVPTADASSPPFHDAGSGETSLPDAAAMQDGPVCGDESWSTLFADWVSEESAPTPPAYYGWFFDRRADFLQFVRTIAVKFSFVDPTTGMPCNTTPGACTYDPTIPRVSPQDVYHSNALGEFIGPDGKRYAWAYFRPTNQWFLASADEPPQGPQGYRWIVEYNAGFSPDCPCDAG
jgi:hypothetical protein